MKIRTEERAVIFETFEYEIPDDFEFPLDTFMNDWTDEEQLQYLQSSSFECNRIGWEYSSESYLDNIDVIE